MPMAPMAGGGENGVENANAFFGNMMRTYQQFSELCVQRGQAYMELPRVLSECQQPDEIFNAEVDFWKEAYHQYKEFADHSLSGPLAVLGGMTPVGQNAKPKKSASNPGPKRKSKTRRKSTRVTAKRRASGNGKAFYTYPEDVSGRSDISGRIH